VEIFFPVCNTWRKQRFKRSLIFDIMKNNFNIAVMPGDGIGPEVVQEALKILKIIVFVVLDLLIILPNI